MNNVKTATVYRVFHNEVHVVEFTAPGRFGIGLLQRNDVGLRPVQQSAKFEQIFPGCRLLDIHEYLMEKGVSLDGVEGVQYMYHDPCHSPMRTGAPLDFAATLVVQPVALSDRCCGEAGTSGDLETGHRPSAQVSKTR